MTPRALVFDTYGTVVDWRSSGLAELEAFGAARRGFRFRPGTDQPNGIKSSLTLVP
jgi:hypothetical protein